MNALERLDLRTLTLLTGGADLWHTHPCPDLDLAVVKMTDGPNGARGAGYEGGPAAACFPIATALAATWDTDLVEEVGKALAAECRQKGAHLLLAPTVNLHRHPLGGRNFECFSEDPELTARMAVAYVRGVQSDRVGCVIKHFVANDSEYERYTISSEVDDRTLREVYLRPFEAAVREAGVWAVMTAYNKLNGVSCSANAWLIETLLRGEWGFDGYVVSDWMGTYETDGSALAGLDIEMPGPPRWFGAPLAEAVEAGRVDRATVEAKVERLRSLALRVAAAERPVGNERGEDDPAVRAIGRRAAAASMVLLRNEVVRAANGEAAPLLPLTVGAGQRVAVIGPLAARGTIMGGGSSQVRPHPVSHPLAALSERLGAAGAEVVYEAGCSIDRYVPEFQPAGGLAAEVALPAKAGEEGVWTSVGAVPRLAVGLSGDGSEVSPRARWRWRGSYTASASGEHTIGLIAAGWGRVWLDGALVLDTTENPTRGGTYYGWGTDELRACYALEAGRTYEVAAEFHPVRSIPFVAMRVGIGPPHDAGALDRAAGLARSADVAVVIVGLTNEWETEGSDRVGFELPAPQAQLIEAVGAACPRTVVVLNIGSPVALDVAAQQPAVLVSWYPGMEFGNALADVLTGAVNPSGRLPTTFPQRLEDCPAYLNYPGEAGRVRYGEGVFIGYRGYDARDVEPAYPFGHGLSYTTFGYADLVVAPSDAGHVVQVTVTNTGTCRGAEVVQCYLAPPPSPVARPPKELVAFAKVDLEPGEQRRVTLELPERVRRYWDATADDWAVAPGEHQVLVGPSSRKLLLRASLVPAG